MAVTVAADNTRRAVATIATDAGTWGNDGGGGGVSDEPDIVYQGTTAQSRKVSTSPIGRSYTDTAGQDLTATDARHMVYKINVTNYAALLTRTSPAIVMKIGSGSGAYYSYNVYGSDNYPASGGWLIVPISPNVSGYRDGTTGSPTLTSILYHSIIADFSATSKSENVVIDAIDFGAGLVMTGGTPDGTYDDFRAADEGTSTNRWGYVTSRAGVLYVVGGLAIGEDASQTAAATQFTDTGGTVVWVNGWCETGFFRQRINLGNASTTVDMTNMTFVSRGLDNNTVGLGYTTTEDTRLVWTTTGTSGTFTADGCVWQNLSSMTLTSACTLTGCTIEAEAITQSGADISESVIQTTSAASTACLSDPTFGTTTDLNNTEFVQAGAGHALEIGSAGSYDLTNITFTDYNASDGQTDSAIFINVASGTVTLNILAGGSSPSYRLPGGSTATVNIVVNPVTLLVNCSDIDSMANIQNARVYVEADTGGPLTAGTVLINDLTDASGNASDTRTLASDQPITGWVRRASSGFGTLYKQSQIAGTIDSANGLTVNILMVPDE